MKRLRQNLPLLFFVVGFVLAGVALLYITHAATPFASVEPEKSNLSGQAQKIIDSTASGGNAVQFGNGGKTIAYGLFQPGAPGKFDAVNAIAAAAGKPPSIIMWYEHWNSQYATTANIKSEMQRVLNYGAVPMLTWMSDRPGGTNGNPEVSTKSTDFTDAAITSGVQDTYIKSVADAMKSLGKPVMLRFDHEMNGDWYGWSPGAVTGQTAANYVAMWKHVHDIFTQEGATNVVWVWAPNIQYNTKEPSMLSLYPGGKYVDWMGLDGYNERRSDTDNKWLSFDEVYKSSMAELNAMNTEYKREMIAEIGTYETNGVAGNTKAAWLTDFLQKLPVEYPRVSAFVYFNQDNTTYDKSGAVVRANDLRLETNAADLKALHDGLNSANYTSNFTP